MGPAVSIERERERERERKRKRKRERERERERERRGRGREGGREGGREREVTGRPLRRFSAIWAAVSFSSWLLCLPYLCVSV